MNPNPLLLRRVVEELPRWSYRFANEAELHRGIADVLAQAGVPFEHEHVAGPRDRFDFLVPSGIVVEAKTKGSFAQALSQCSRYLARDDVSAVVLVAARLWGRTAPTYHTKSGKQVHVVHLRGAAF